MDKYETLTVVVVVILIIALAVAVLMLAGWIATSYQMMKLLSEVGYAHSALAWLPISGNVYNMLGQCELFCSGKVTESKVLWGVAVANGVLAYTSGSLSVFSGSDNPVIIASAFIIPLTVGLLGTLLWIGGIVAVVMLCDRLSISKLAPLLCYILVPFFGKAICVSLIRKGVRAGKVVM